MNTKHPTIRSIFEIEDQNSFSRLDVRIIRNTEKKSFRNISLQKKYIQWCFY